MKIRKYPPRMLCGSNEITCEMLNQVLDMVANTMKIVTVIVCILFFGF